MASSTPADVPRGVRHDTDVFFARKDSDKLLYVLLDLFAFFIGDLALGGLCQCEDFHDPAVLLKSFRVGATATLESDGVHGRGDFRLERIVGRLGAVRNDKFRSIGQRRQHGQHRFGKSSDLVGLDQGGVDLPVLCTGFDVRVLGCDQVVANDEHLISQFFHQVLPAFVVEFAETVLNGQDRYIVFHGLLVEFENFVPAHIELALVAPETIHADRVFLTGFFAV